MDEILGTNASRIESKKEGPIAKAIEQRTAKLPSDLFLWAAGAAVIGSAVLQLVGQRRNVLMRGQPRHLSLFIGEWVPSLLLLGVYNKIVKLLGSDRFTS